MWAPSDEALLIGMGAGDPDAAVAFVDRFQRRVYGMTLSILRDRGAAEEAAQDTFVRAWKHAEAYDSRRGSVAAWLLTIARNMSINMLPRRRPDPVDPDVLPALQDPAPARDEGQLTPVSEPIRAALVGLPADQRRPLVLAVFYGYTAREIAELDRLPLGTVKTRIRTALHRLRTDIGAGDDGSPMSDEGQR